MKKILLIGATDWKFPRLTEFFERRGFLMELKSLDQYDGNSFVDATFFLTSSQSLLPAYEEDFLSKHPNIKNLIIINPDFDEYADVLQDLKKRHSNLDFLIYDEKVLSSTPTDYFSPDQIDYMLKSLSFITELLKLNSLLLQVRIEKEEETRKVAGLQSKIDLLQPEVEKLNHHYQKGKDQISNLTLMYWEQATSIILSFNFRNHSIGFSHSNKINATLREDLERLNDINQKNLYFSIFSLLVIGAAFFYDFRVGIAASIAFLCICFDRLRIMKEQTKTTHDHYYKSMLELNSSIKRSDEGMEYNYNQQAALKKWYKEEDYILRVKDLIKQTGVEDSLKILKNMIPFNGAGGTVAVPDPEKIEESSKVKVPIQVCFQVIQFTYTKIVEEFTLLKDGDGKISLDPQRLVIRHDYLPSDDYAPFRIFEISSELVKLVQLYDQGKAFEKNKLNFFKLADFGRNSGGEIIILNSLDSEVQLVYNELIRHIQPDALAIYFPELQKSA